MRQRHYRDLLAAARTQPTDWLARCAAEPSSGMIRGMLGALSRLAIRTALQERTRSFPVDISHITEYGQTMRLSRATRVF